MILNKLNLIATVSLDFYNNNIKTINVKQCDTNSRFIHVSFTEHGKKVALNQSTMSAIVRYKKPDGKFGLRDCKILEDGSVLIELNEQMTVVSGKTQVDVMILEESGIKADSFANITSFEEYGVAVLSTMPLYLNVIATPIQGAELESAYDFTPLNECFASVKAIESDIIEKNIAWTSAEEQREARVTNLIQNCQKSVNDKIDEFTTKTDDAVSKANVATSDANIATTSATNAAENANVATTYANDAATYANSEAKKCKEVIEECESTIDRANLAAENCQGIVDRTGIVMKTEKGVAGGVASLDETGKVPEEQLPEIKSYNSEGENSFATNDGAVAFGDYSFASGENTISGYKGYHMVGYSKSADGLSVDITVRDLELSEKASDNYAIGDIVCVEADNHLFREHVIDNIVGSAVSNSVITLKRVDGQAINFELEGSKEEENWLFVIDNNVGEPIPQFIGAFVAGLNNISAGKGAFGGGLDNIGSNYSLYGGRNNQVAYAGFVAGLTNKILGQYSGAVGFTNSVPFNYSFLGGAKNKITGESAAGFGYNNTIGEMSFGAGNNNYVGKNGAVFGSNNYIGDYGFGSGKYGIKDTNNEYLVNIGNGTEEGRSSAVLVEHDGTTKLSGKVYSENNKELATVAYVNAKIEQGEVSPTPSPNPNYVSCAMGNNQIYGGRDITAMFDSGELSERIADGTFENIYLGDYISKPVTIDGKTCDCKFIVADLDYYYSLSNVQWGATQKHHIAVIVDGLPPARMNDSDFDDTTGYRHTEMQTVTLPHYLESIKSALGGETHLVSNNKLLTSRVDKNAINAYGNQGGAPMEYNWLSGSCISLMNEVQVYGNTVWSASGHNIGEAMRQLSIFKLKFYTDVIGDSKTYSEYNGIWLRDIVSYNGCALASFAGYAGNAHVTTEHCVNPLILVQ